MSSPDASPSPLRERNGRRRIQRVRAKRRVAVSSSESSSSSEDEAEAEDNADAHRDVDASRRRRVHGRGALDSESEAGATPVNRKRSDARARAVSGTAEVASAAPRDVGGAATSAVGPMRLKGVTASGGRFELRGELAMRLHDHQRMGVRWMWGLQLAGRGGILADDMGLGKTLQACAFVAGLLRGGAVTRVLILAPATILPNWVREFETCGLESGKTLFKYFSGMSRTARERQRDACVAGGGVLLTSYETMAARAVELGAPQDEDDAEKAMSREGRGCTPRGFAGEFRWDWIIADEGHTLQNLRTEKARKVRQLPANLRMLVTGTPIQSNNDLQELWSLYDFTCPGLLGTENEYRRQFSHKIVAGESASATQKQRAEAKELRSTLEKLLCPYYLRRTKDAVFAAKERDAERETEAITTNQLTPTKMNWKNWSHAPPSLGQKNDLIAWIPLESEQASLYKKFLSSKPVQDAINKIGSAISCMNTLKKICDHPSLCVGEGVREEEDCCLEPADEMAESEEVKKSCAGEAAAAVATAVRDCEFDVDALHQASPTLSAKTKFLMSMLDRFRREGRRTLVFSQSQRMLDIIEGAIRADNLKFVRIDGKSSVEERDRRVSHFRSNDDIPIMLLTARVGGLGLTITEATRVIIYDPAWNPTTDNQSVDRAYRIGQTQNVVVYRLITCGTVEEKIYRRQVFKSGHADGASGARYFDTDATSQLFEANDKDMRLSDTMKQLNLLHASDRKWTDELRSELSFVESLSGVCGVSDHDLLFSKDVESTTSSKSADTSRKVSAGPKETTTEVASSKSKTPAGAAWKNVNSGWGGDGGLLGGAFLAAVTPPKSKKTPSEDNDNESPERLTGEAKLKAKIDRIQSDMNKKSVILSMPDVVARMPDKGERAKKEIQNLLAEKQLLEAEYAAKYTRSTVAKIVSPLAPAVEVDPDREVVEDFFTPEGSPEVAVLESVRSMKISIN